jgi:hypothetical protein
MQTVVDGVGILIGTREGKHPELPSVALDPTWTLPNGRDFDGALGLAAAIEVARTINEDGVELQRGLQAMSFACEEGSRFGVGCVGSKALVGELSWSRKEFAT